ncbi:MAG: gamma-glutamylcyclotransferase family protein [Clostridia bacterium]|nr:gamma-glutamylcyclotransferase family protein [Clostridia bacterium]
MKKTDLYLAYGSNLNLRQMRFRCPTAKVVGSAVLEDYKMVFRGAHRSGVATIEKCKGFKVPVLIWKITSADERSLDRYEGYPIFYRKEYFDVELNGKKQKAMVYIMNEGREKNYPSKYYFRTILEGYITAKFDEKILNSAVNKLYDD